jgi:hypothetical protein
VPLAARSKKQQRKKPAEGYGTRNEGLDERSQGLVLMVSGGEECWWLGRRGALSDDSTFAMMGSGSRHDMCR